MIIYKIKDRSEYSYELWKQWYSEFESMYPTSYKERHIELQKMYPEMYEEIKESNENN